jgi:NAD(P)H-flavin reductase
MSGHENIYRPMLMSIGKVITETPDVRTFQLHFAREEDRKNFTFRAGQFAEYSVFGVGECTFCIASSPTRMEHIECTFRKTGRVTSALFRLGENDQIGFRGPYGNSFPIEECFGKNLYFVAGGIALPPLRTLIWNCLDWRDKFADITIVYGARTVEDLVYKHELEEWQNRDDVRLVTTVDPGGETPDWKGEVGFVPAILEKIEPGPENAVAFVCGPPIMIKYTLPVLARAGFDPEQAYTTLENRMKCGLGKCGRCNVGGVYVCIDGPVFSQKQLQALPAEY